MSDLQDYIETEDPNFFWRLSSGQHENLLDTAIEKIQERDELLKLIHDDLKMRGNEEGVVEISGFIWLQIKDAIGL